jgi:hypothetical protein
MMYLSYIEHITALILETTAVSTDRNHGLKPWRYSCNIVLMGVALRKPVSLDLTLNDSSRLKRK